VQYTNNILTEKDFHINVKDFHSLVYHNYYL